SCLDDAPVANQLLPTSDKIKDELRYIGIVAHNNENGRRTFRTSLRVLFPKAIVFFIVAIETEQGSLQFGREFRLSAYGLGLAALLGQVLADAEPQVTVCGLLAGHGVVRDRNAGNLDDACFNCVDE